MIRTLVDRCESLLKGVTFGCRSCGQCVLRANAMTCPMRCPKGLRNGPCGGTLGSRCEVYPDRPCIHVRIHVRRHGGRVEQAPIMPAINHALVGSASVINAYTGADRGCRDPLPALTNAGWADGEPRTASRLEAALRAGQFVVTTEVRAPRGSDMSRLRREAAGLRGHFDAVNATAYLSGNPSLPSSVVARELQDLGIESVAQITARDCTRTTFVGELLSLAHAKVNNLLCLTGDWRVGTPMVKPVYDLDSSLMLYEARHLRDRSRIFHTGEEVAQPARPFLGCAINPLSDPIDVPVRRLRQKADCGAEFAQTQVLTEMKRLDQFMTLARAQDLPRRVAIIAGIPVVTSAKALAHLHRIAGVSVDPGFAARLAAAKDLRAVGVQTAIELCQQARAIPGVAGVHLMLFGADHTALIDVRNSLPHHSEIPCHSPV
ncbi:MAG: methylenetetrahydrofolate reductase C-terminal domain-containing protein [Planctomycetota bacterium]